MKKVNQLIVQNYKVMSDSKFEYIDNVILNVDKDRVEKKKKSPVKPLALLILGAAILWYGANHVNTAQSDTLSSGNYAWFGNCNLGYCGIFGKKGVLCLQANRESVEKA